MDDGTHPSVHYKRLPTDLHTNETGSETEAESSLLVALSCVNVVQLAVFVIGAMKLNKCSTVPQLPIWLIVQASCTILWHFLVNILRFRTRLESLASRFISEAVGIVALLGFFIAHFVFMFFGVVWTYSIFDIQKRYFETPTTTTSSTSTTTTTSMPNTYWSYDRYGRYQQPSYDRYPYYPGYTTGEPSEATCDPLAYWTAFAVANAFMLVLAAFFLAVAVRTVCGSTKKSHLNRMMQETV